MNQITTPAGTISEGTTITFRPMGGMNLKVVITEVAQDIKNSRPGFEGTIIQGPRRGQTVWGYADQVLAIR